MVAKYQKKQLYTQFIKVYNTLSNAFSLTTAQNGNLDSWGITDDDYDVVRIFNTYLAPYLKISKIESCGSLEDFDYPVSELDGTASETNYKGETTEYTLSRFVCSFNRNGESETPVAMLNDGSIVSLHGVSSSDMTLRVDTNGEKGPNMFGRDVFSFVYAGDRLLPEYDYYAENTEPDSDGYFDYANCNPEISNEYNGKGCAARLLLEGKMDY